MDWSKLDLVVFSSATSSAKGLACLPADNVLHPLQIERRNGVFKLAGDPLAGKAVSTVQT
jgi:hypothetical protein